MSDLPDPPFADEDELSIRTRMLTVIDPAFSTDEGDLIYDMLTPAAMEMDLAYDAIEIALGESFVTTASGDFLTALGLQFAGLTRSSVDETDIHFRARVTARLLTPAGAGTAADWRGWVLGYSTGIGFVTVEEAWAGAGTVRVLAAEPDRDPIAGGVVTSLAAYLNANFTPLGVTLTVAAITNVSASFEATVVLAPGWVLSEVETAAALAIEVYVNTLNPGDDVVWAEVIAVLMGVEGITDITNLDIDGLSVNYAVAADELFVQAATILTV